MEDDPTQQKKRFISRNPWTDEVTAEFDAFDLDRLGDVLQQMATGQAQWERREMSERASLLDKIARTLRRDAEKLARLATEEMGKTLSSGRAEVEKCALVCDYYAKHGAGHLQDQHLETEHSRSYVSFQPLGVLLAIMPWNFPYWQVFRFLAPALMAGNAVVLKHARNVPGCAMAIEHCLREAGLSDTIFRTLLVSSDDSSALISHPLIRGVTFTGSTEAGRRVAALAADNIKKTVLELGGSDPYLVLADADLDMAVEACVASRLINNGQSCIAAKRFIVHTSLHDAFVEAMAGAFRRKKTGNPLHEDTDIGPLARPDLSEKLAEQVERTLAAGAKRVAEGSPEGNMYPPTVLTDVVPGMAAFDEELFGPVAAVIRADSDEHAIELANRSEFGLGAAVFTRDTEKGEMLARTQLRAGCCFVNALVASDPRLPFGGIKASGYGRELGPLGITEFTNIKTVVVK